MVSFTSRLFYPLRKRPHCSLSGMSESFGGMKTLCPCQESSHVPSVSVDIGGGGGESDASLKAEREFTFQKIEGYRNGIVLYLGTCFV